MVPPLFVRYIFIFIFVFVFVRMVSIRRRRKGKYLMIRASQINDDIVFAWDAALLHPLQELIAGDGGRGGAGGGKRCVPGLRHVDSFFSPFFNFFALFLFYCIVCCWWMSC